jgi:hypothetical protein
MDFGAMLRGVYLDRFFPADGPPQVEYVGAETSLRLLWPSLMRLRARILAATDLSAGSAFEGDADMALARLAESGDFGVWEDLNAGTWAVLSDRLMWSATVLALAMGSEDGIKMMLPRGAPEDVRQLATLLWLLGGPGRTPSDQWRELKPAERRVILLSEPFSRQ